MGTVAGWLETDYLVHRELRPSSAYQLRRSVALFSRWLGRDAIEADLTDRAVSRWLASLDSDYAAATRYKMRGDLLAVWRSMEHVPPPRRVRVVRVPHFAPVAWTDAEVAKILAACPMLPTNRSGRALGPYFAALVSVNWDTGLRVGDLRSIRLSAFGVDGTLAPTQRKTGWPVVCRVRPETLDRLRLLGRDPPLEWWHSKRMLYYWWHRLKTLAEVQGHGAFQRIRRSATTAVEVHSPGHGFRFLGHTTPAIAARHYIDPRIVGAVVARPPSLG